MSQIKLKLLDEKLQYYIEPPYITNGNKGINTVSLIFDRNWNFEDISKYLYIIKNNSVSNRILIEGDECQLPDNALEDSGEIYFCVVAENSDETVIKTSSRLKLNIYEGIKKDDIITEYPEIKLYRGCASTINFDFSSFQFYNGYVELTIKRKTNSKSLFSYEFRSNQPYEILFDSDFTGQLNYSSYLYDLVYIVDDDNDENNTQRYPLCLPSKITVMEMVNDG